MSTNAPTDVLVVGATGSIGELVVAESIRRGHRTRALVRDRGRTASLPGDAQIVVGDLTQADTLTEAIDGVHAVVFTHGSHGGARAAELVDYGAVRNVLQVLGGRPARIALMTAIGVTNPYPGHDWKRRSERLVRASGLPYTIVRPGWFDYNQPDQLELVMLQGDRRHAGTPADGVVSRRQIAEVLVASLSSPAAERKTLELVAERGPAPTDLDPLFSALQPDPQGALDAVLDIDNMPLSAEPTAVRQELAAFSARGR
ncbi:hypothetical protein IN07_10260 [Modestobacter caceresii]|uniref:NAD(P)-binding domain-containing protein n=1 Tax=Modestobacter caceresii TaxID=1522368 RepID=A0A098YAQ0_9ACTN|nr:SDR family oxidoreductase [Modestobacter caceresii]KGH46816.1 hypothetical protein IN07_10260 [Modestobacter caceresii]